MSEENGVAFPVSSQFSDDSPPKQSHRCEEDEDDGERTEGWRDRVEKKTPGGVFSMQVQCVDDVFFFLCSVSCWGRESVDGGKDRGMEEDRGEDSAASDVGDGTFAVFLQGDVYVGRGDVALLSALLPRPRPAVTFVFLDNIQHLKSTKRQCGTEGLRGSWFWRLMLRSSFHAVKSFWLNCNFV